jgi:16S rRNA (guanine966-N2)-methyltransferase
MPSKPQAKIAPGKTASSKSAVGKVRIVGGQYKRTPLSVPNLPGLRPTPDRVRETLFNWLAGFTEGARCLDLFAGTGALGLEAASRGAKDVLLIESSKVAAAQIIDTLNRLKQPENVQLKVISAETFISRYSDNGGNVGNGSPTGDAGFDLIFLDPPFGKDFLAKFVPRLAELLNTNGKVYVESDEPIGALLQRLNVEAQWRVERAANAGQVYYHLLSLVR